MEKPLRNCNELFPGGNPVTPDLWPKARRFGLKSLAGAPIWLCHFYFGFPFGFPFKTQQTNGTRQQRDIYPSHACARLARIGPPPSQFRAPLRMHWLQLDEAPFGQRGVGDLGEIDIPRLAPRFAWTPGPPVERLE